jgi:hypothetical protein
MADQGKSLIRITPTNGAFLLLVAFRPRSPNVWAESSSSHLIGGNRHASGIVGRHGSARGRGVELGVSACSRIRLVPVPTVECLGWGFRRATESRGRPRTRP